MILRGQRTARDLGFISLLAGVLCLMSCVIPAPIDEEEPAPDEPPRFDGVNDVEPPPGRVFLQLDVDFNPTVFVLRGVEDPNPEQTLYWRRVAVYRNAVVATEAIEVPPSETASIERPTIVYQYSPCAIFEPDLPHVINLEEPRAHLLYLAVSDAEFATPGSNTFPVNDGLRLALETKPSGLGFNEDGEERLRAPALASWTVIFDGDCPSF